MARRLIGCALLTACTAPVPLPDDAGAAPPFAPLTDETLELAPGWSAGLFHDLSGEYGFNPNDFVDTDETNDNAPTSIAALAPPLGEGLAVTAGRLVLEVPPRGATVLHDFRPVAADGTGPDDLTDITWGYLADTTGPAMWVTSASNNGGDGFYSITSQWRIDPVVVLNDVKAVTFDPAGAFTGRAEPELLFGNDNDGIETIRGLARAELDILDLGSLADGSLLAVVDESATQRLERLASAAGSTTVIGTASAYHIADGGLRVDGADAWIVRDHHALDALANNALSPVVKSDTASWTWVAAAAPDRGPLAGAIYVLESDRAANRDRVIALVPP